MNLTGTERVFFQGNLSAHLSHPVRLLFRCVRAQILCSTQGAYHAR